MFSMRGASVGRRESNCSRSYPSQLQGARVRRRSLLGSGELSRSGSVSESARSPHSARSTAHATQSPQGGPQAFSSRSRSRVTRGDADARALTVVARVRPFLAGETAHDDLTAVTFDQTQPSSLTILSPRGREAEDLLFTFDDVVWSVPDTTTDHAEQSQTAVHKLLGEAAVAAVVEGYHSCVLAYGQTGSGKTYTMLGSDTTAGLTQRAVTDLFRLLGEKRVSFHGSPGNSLIASVELSALEIYNDRIYDLLRAPSSRTPTLRVRHDPSVGAFVPHLRHVRVKDSGEALRALRMAMAHRTTAATQMNERSSRSHAIFRFTVSIQCKGEGDGPAQLVQMSTLNMVDLAGSERVGMLLQPGMAGYDDGGVEHYKEACSVNLSLSSLRRVIDSLIEMQKSPGSAVVPPYRDSQLTLLLSDSFGGNSVTSFVACVSPAVVHTSETIATLRYAATAKSIVNRVRRNVQVAGWHPHALHDDVHASVDTLSPAVPSEVSLLEARLAEAEARAMVVERALSDMQTSHHAHVERLTAELERAEAAAVSAKADEALAVARAEALTASNATVERNATAAAAQKVVLEHSSRVAYGATQAALLSCVHATHILLGSALQQRSELLVQFRTALDACAAREAHSAAVGASLEARVQHAERIAVMASDDLQTAVVDNRADYVAAQVRIEELEAAVASSAAAAVEGRRSEAAHDDALADSRMIVQRLQYALEAQTSELASLRRRCGALEDERDQLAKAVRRAGALHVSAHSAALAGRLDVDAKLSASAALTRQREVELGLLNAQVSAARGEASAARDAAAAAEARAAVAALRHTEAQQQLLSRCTQMSREVDSLRAALQSVTLSSPPSLPATPTNASSDSRVLDLSHQLQRANAAASSAEAALDAAREGFEKERKSFSAALRASQEEVASLAAQLAQCAAQPISLCDTHQSSSTALSAAALSAEVSVLRAALDDARAALCTAARDTASRSAHLSTTTPPPRRTPATDNHWRTPLTERTDTTDSGDRAGGGWGLRSPPSVCGDAHSDSAGAVARCSAWSARLHEKLDASSSLIYDVARTYEHPVGLPTPPVQPPQSYSSKSSAGAAARAAFLAATLPLEPSPSPLR